MKMVYDLHHIVVGMAGKALDILVPRLSEEYDLKLHKPSLSTSISGYMDCAGKFIPSGDYGVIKLEQEYCSRKVNCCTITSHEMGHASFYQNFALYKKFDEEDTEGYINLLEEGVSEKFMKKGLKILKDEKHITALDYYSRSTRIFLSNSIKGLFPDQYFLGELVVDFYLKKGVKMKDLVVRADEFKANIEKVGWENLIKFYSNN
ncbi:hypothetical protein FJZ53_03525 [Candidatus Woesearchaeota archaeon]|nr:hypothetical protein [Candidatus Woesearchaeota archaeon]